MSPRPGPWIEHDGKGWPAAVVAAERARGIVGIGLVFSTESGRRSKTPVEMAGPYVDPASPAWVWAWRWVWRGGWPFRRRVCGDRAYRPILRYRFFYDTPPGAQAQVELLREIAAGRRQPAPEPVPGETVSDAAHGGRIPRGSNAGFSPGRDAGFHPPGDGGGRSSSVPSAAPGIGDGNTSLLTSPGADRVGGLFGGASRKTPPCVRGVGAVVTRSFGCTPKAARLAVEQRRCADEQCG